MPLQAKVLRLMYGPDGDIDPGTVVDIDEWATENIRALEADNVIRVLHDDDSAALIEENKALTARVAELEAQLVDNAKAAPAKAAAKEAPAKTQKKAPAKEAGWKPSEKSGDK